MLDLGFLPAIEKVMNHPTMVPNVRKYRKFNSIGNFVHYKYDFRKIGKH